MYSPLLETKKGTGAEMHPAIGSGIATGDAPVSYWPIVSLSQVSVPEVFAKVNLTHFPIRFLRGDWRIIPNYNELS